MISTGRVGSQAACATDSGTAQSAIVAPNAARFTDLNMVVSSFCCVGPNGCPVLNANTVKGD